MTKPAVALSTLLLALVGPASAQLISIRTVPIAQGDQFDIFPSNNVGMGGVSIALADTLLDPFLNPAKGARLGAVRFLGSPTVYSVSKGAGGGRTLPLAAVTHSGPWFAGLSLALQEVDPSRPPVDRGLVINAPIRLDPIRLDTALALPTVPPRRDSYGNQYAFGMLGRVVPGTGLSFGGSVLWARLSALDGVDLLYAGSAGIKQFGHAVDVRLGVLKEWAGGRSLEALVLHNRFGMTHDVAYLDPIWDPATQRIALRPRLEHNLDRTNTWGLHLAYERPLLASGWRIGWLATANRMSHPKLPEYELVNVPVIPRDPGHSSAYNVGIGLSKTRGAATFGLDLVYEPIWSYTWADAAAPVVTAVGDTIPVGGKTVENRFRFSNGVFRMGVGRDVEVRGLGKALGLQLGLVVRSMHYRLAQYDNVQAAGRGLEEGWLEWTPTWGLSLRFPELEIRYRGRVTHGTGRPGVQPLGVFPGATRDVALAGGGILVAPNGPLTLEDVRTTTHQISVSLPLR
jgi:hypothetical protein